jgi:uncharacterized protein (UPF0335 family)
VEEKMTAPRPESSPSAPRRASAEASAKPRKMAEEDGCKATISVNGGPQIPFDEAHEAQIMDELVPVVARGMAAADAKKHRVGEIAADQLRSIVERIERLEEEKASLADDIKEIYLESKSAGLCPKTIRKIIALRKQDAAERDEAEALLNTYLHAMGMQSSFNFDDKQ